MAKEKETLPAEPLSKIKHLLVAMDGTLLDHARMPAHAAVELLDKGYVFEAKLLEEAALQLEAVIIIK